MHYFPIDHNHELTAKTFTGCCKDCERSFLLVEGHLQRFHRTISAYTDEDLHKLSQKELYQLYLVLDDIAHLECGDHLAELIMASKEIQQLLPTIRNYYTTFFDLHETTLAREILGASDPWHPLKNFGLYSRYQELIRSQVEILNLPFLGRLAFIGCGPVPLSLILLCKSYSIHSIGFDTDPEAISLARRCVSRLGMTDMVEIIEGNEESLEGTEWDMVLVAALAEPKKRIFSALARIMTDSINRPVICRTYSGLRGLLHPPMSEEDHKDFRIQYILRPGNRVNNTILLLEKRDENDI